MSASSLSSQIYLDLFLDDGADAIDRLITSIRARKDRVVQEWHGLYASRFGAHRAISDGLFQDAYGPTLRTAMNSIIAGDTAGFVASAATVGEEVARAEMPFAAMVSHLNLWKESCAKAFADTPDDLCAAMVLLDKLACCFVSAAADGYYRRCSGQCDAPRRGADGPAAAQSPGLASRVFYGLVGSSAAMQQIFQRVKQLGSSNVPVLIVGETGTGKELVAQAIHQCGRRSAYPFIGVNCAALPRELIESELFGYRRGAFSGAVGEHLGLFRAASGGTLLLDEITEMNLDLQAKLLRALQERVVRPVGSVSEVPIDVRIIASTNRDPAKALSSGQLRQDLYYRLCGSVVSLPPLRDRADDIPLLVEHYVSTLSERSESREARPRGVTPRAMELLRTRPWFGNVRELFNTVESVFTSCTEQHIGVADLETAPHIAAESNGVVGLFEAARPVGPMQTFAENERALIERSLAATGGNKLRAAQQLGISRKKLYAKIAKYALLMMLLGFAETMPVAPYAGSGRPVPRLSTGAYCAVD